MLGVTLTGLVSSLVVGHGVGLPFLVAPMGASGRVAVRNAFKPSGPALSIIGGNTISAAIGITVTHLVPDPMIAAASLFGTRNCCDVTSRMSSTLQVEESLW